MLLFVVYAVLLCYGAFVGRRRFGGFAAIAAGMLVLVMVNTVHGHIARVFHYEQLLPVFRVLMYPYMGLVFVCGMFFAMLPIELPRGELHCRLCRYDLTDLLEEMYAGGRCPECGATLAQTHTRKGRRLARMQQRVRNLSEPEPMPGLRTRLHPLAHHDESHSGVPRLCEPCLGGAFSRPAACTADTAVAQDGTEICKNALAGEQSDDGARDQHEQRQPADEEPAGRHEPAL